MNNEEILTKAIQKAIDGGWDIFQHRKDTVPPWYVVAGGQMPTPKVVEAWVPKNSLLICGVDQDYYFVWEHILFNHDFAKALWGEETERFWECPNYDECYHRIEWYKHNETQMHCPADGRKVKDVTHSKPVYEQKWADQLQQMVIAGDPIKYLGDNI